MLEHIAQKPIIGVVKRFKQLGLKTAQGYPVITELIDHQLIQPRTIDRQKLYELTPAGKTILGPKFKQKGRGGLAHRYYVEKIKTHYLNRQGFAFIEKDNIDLVVESTDQTLAIQVETGKSDIRANLMRLGRFAADQKYVLAITKQAEIKIKDIFAVLIIPDKQSIRVQYIKDFISNPPSLTSNVP
jgi:hypothetical protein